MSAEFACMSRLEAGKEAWDAFAERSEEAWLWHTWDLQEALAGWRSSFDDGFAITDAGGGPPLAIVPLRGARTRTARVARTSELESLGGPAIAEGVPRRRRVALLHRIGEELRRRVERHRATELTVSLSSLAPAYRGERCPRVNPLVELDAESVVSQTWMVDLDVGREALWERLEGRARTAVRKARKEGVTVRPAEPADLDAYYRLHRATYFRTAEHPHPRAYFEAMWSRFLGRGRAMILIAELDSNPVAAQSFGLFKDGAAYWTGANDERGLRRGAPSLLQWTALEALCERGFRWYEAGEAFPAARSGKQRGLSEFKRSTGGELYPLFGVRLRARSRPLRIALAARELWRSTRGEGR